MFFFKRKNDNPTVFHITHYKAGSQWIRNILNQTCKNMIVNPKPNNDHLYVDKIQKGKIYSTVYLKKDDFDALDIDREYKKFIIFRDPRDTLISHYFSLLKSHVITSDNMRKTRDRLENMSKTDGLNWFMETVFTVNTDIVKSWIDNGESFLKYEDILKDDVGILTRLFCDELKLDMDCKRLKKIIIKNRFEAITKGRKRGEEDISSHLRKGIKGDWENHFTAEIKDRFKELYGSLLVDMDYEKDLEW